MGEFILSTRVCENTENVNIIIININVNKYTFLFIMYYNVTDLLTVKLPVSEIKTVQQYAVH